MGNNSVPKFIFRLSRFPVYRGSVLGRFYCINGEWVEGDKGAKGIKDEDAKQNDTVLNLSRHFHLVILRCLSDSNT
jgi:hypothetical protein